MKSGESIYNLNSEAAEKEISAEEKVESPSTKELGQEIRGVTVESIKSASEKFAEVKNKLFGGIKKLFGKSKEVAVDALDTVIGGTAKGIFATGRGIEKTTSVVANTPDWLMDKAGEGLGATAEAAEEAGTYVVEKGREAGAYVTETAGEAVNYVADKTEEGVDWTKVKLNEGGEWVDEKYSQAGGWAMEKVTQIQEKAGDIKESFNGKIDAVKAWKDNAVLEYQQNKKIKEFLKLKSELEDVASRQERLKLKQEEITNKMREIDALGDLSAKLGIV